MSKVICLFVCLFGFFFFQFSYLEYEQQLFADVTNTLLVLIRVAKYEICSSVIK